MIINVAGWEINLDKEAIIKIVYEEIRKEVAKDVRKLMRLPEMKESTKKRRIRGGYDPQDALKRTGELMSSIKVEMDDSSVSITGYKRIFYSRQGRAIKWKLVLLRAWDNSQKRILNTMIN